LRGALVASFCAASYRVPALSWWQQQGWEMSALDAFDMVISRDLAD